MEFAWQMYFRQEQTALGGTGQVPTGGTGQTSVPAGGVLIGNGTNPLNATAAGALHQVLEANPATNIPRWTFWPLLKQSIAATEQMVIDAGFSLAIAGPLTNSGAILNSGTLMNL
jgi:hypothetical protein